MAKIYNYLLLLPLILSSNAALAKKEPKQNKTVIEALKNGTPYLNLNYRYEFVDQKDLDNANASTLRTALGYKTGEFKKISATLEVENISEIGEQRYDNSTANSKTNYAKVADPKGTEINQAYVNWRAPAKTNARLGRQEIRLDNERFIGVVAWRQNHQSMDAALISNNYLKDFNFTYAFVERVNRIFGPDSTVGILDDNNINLFNISYSGLKNTKITVYDYLLDIEDPLTAGGTAHRHQIMAAQKLLLLKQFLT